MRQDGGLRKLFRKHLPHVHWTSIESRFTESGIPDIHGLYAGADFFIELKLTKGWAVNLRPSQIAWILRRVRNGGRVFIAVRRKGSNGADELYLVPGSQVRLLARRGLPRGLVWYGRSPSHWDWPAVLGALQNTPRKAHSRGF